MSNFTRPVVVLLSLVAVIVALAVLLGACGESPHRDDDFSLVDNNIVLVPTDEFVSIYGDRDFGSVEALTASSEIFVRDSDSIVTDANVPEERPSDEIVTFNRLDTLEEQVDFINDRYETDLTDDQSELVAELFANVTVLEITSPDPDARGLVENLRSDGDIDARPVHAVKYEGHWGRLPGVEPTLINSSVSEAAANYAKVATAMGIAGAGAEQAEDPTGPKVGIVDSGFLDVAKPFVNFDAKLYGDKVGGTSGVSHGTFVASVIKQINPDVAIWGTAASPLNGTEAEIFVTADKKPIGTKLGGHQFNDEIAIGLAIFAVFKAEPGIEYLNMSFGSLGAHTGTPHSSQFGCGGSPGLAVDSDLPGTTMAPAMIERALSCRTAATMFAAGGNQPQVEPSFPAAFEIVTGVGAVRVGDETDGKIVMWDDDGNEQDETMSDYKWIDRIERGCDLIGIGSDPPNQLVMWSGSSFASAVATGKASGGTGPLPDSLITKPTGTSPGTHC